LGLPGAETNATMRARTLESVLGTLPAFTGGLVVPKPVA
jgi:hypothetical protein